MSSSLSSSPRCLAKLNGNMSALYKYLRALSRATSRFGSSQSRRSRESREAFVKIRSDNLVCVTIRTIKFFFERCFLFLSLSLLAWQPRICCRMSTSTRERINFQLIKIVHKSSSLFCSRKWLEFRIWNRVKSNTITFRKSHCNLYLQMKTCTVC